MRLKRAAMFAGGLIVAWIVISAALVALAARDLSAGVESARRAEARLEPSTIRDGSVLPEVASARVQFRQAADRLRHPLLAPARVLPVVGRQLRSAAALAETAADVSAAGDDALRDGRALLVFDEPDAAERIRIARELGAVAGRTARRLAGVDLGPRRALFGVLASRRAELEDRVTRLRDGLESAAAASTATADLLTGQRRILVLGANNAEMRAGSGMFLSVGVIDVDDGTMHFRGARHTAEFTLPADIAPPMTGDLAARWGWLSPNREWRNVNLTPRFDVSAALAADMWRAATGESVDAVVAVDVVGLESILGATGAVSVEPDVTVDADGVRTLLLHDQYEGLTFSSEGHEARRERVGGVAAATFAALDEGRFEPAQLASRLAEAAVGRHVLVWSSRPAEQEAWIRAGAAGVMRPESVLVGLINRGANKLDQFLDVAVDLRVERRTTELHDLVLSASITNNTPLGAPLYVAGPAPGFGAAEGEYVGYVAFTLPGALTEASRTDATDVVVQGPDGPTRVMVVEVRIPRGQTAEVGVRFSLPAASDELVVEPSGTADPVTWSFGHEGPRIEVDRPRLVRVSTLPV